jgi:hypothetical protein
MHPVAYDLAYEVERNRLTTFFRLIVAIPWFIVAYVYYLIAGIAAIIAWFAMLFTKRYPQGLYDFNAGYIRFHGRVTSWILLGTDTFPPIWGNEDPNYPAQVAVAGPQPEYSRAKTFFKLVLIFPQQLILYGLGGVMMGAAFVTWWRVLFTGKQSATMHDALKICVAYAVRAQAFLLLLTEVHPRLMDVPPTDYPADAPALPDPSVPLATLEAPAASTPTPPPPPAPAT